VYSEDGIAPTISATIYKEPNVILVKETGRVIQLGNLIPDTENFKNKQAGRVYSINGISPTLNTCGGAERTEDYCK
jgi:DNA (cytosine-5)-methyltransferase 1